MKWVLNCNDRFVMFYMLPMAAHGLSVFWLGRLVLNGATLLHTTSTAANPYRVMTIERCTG